MLEGFIGRALTETADKWKKLGYRCVAVNIEQDENWEVKGLTMPIEKLK